MADVLVTLLKAYRRHGFKIRTGLNPMFFGDPDAAFTRLFYDDGSPVTVGGGIAPQEIRFFECLVESGLRPANILVIGNAFGWSATALALMSPDATVVAIDAGVEGEAAQLGTELTQAIAVEEGLDVRVVEALSPGGVAQVVASEFGDAPLDFVLIDGLHTNEQLLRDFDAVAPHAGPGCVFALHDVLSWHMVEAFERLEPGPNRERRILTRCPSGMGLVFPSGMTSSVREVIDAYGDETVDLSVYYRSVGATAADPGPTLVGRLAPCWRSRRVAMAGLYEMEGRLDLAEEQVALALTDGAGDVETQSQVATCLIERGRWHEAETALRSVREQAPNWEVPAHQLGCVIREQGRHAEARDHLEDAARLRPDWAAPMFDLGLVMQALDGDAAAAPYFRRASHLDPSAAMPMFHLGCVMQSLEGDTAAAPYFERTIELDPDWAEPLCELGAIRYRQGDDLNGIECLERCVALKPDLAAAHHLLGLAKGRRTGPRAALSALERAVALDPSCAFVQFDVGLVKQQLQDYHGGLRHLTTAAMLTPDWADAWTQASVCAAEAKQWSQAVACLTRAAALGPTNLNQWKDLARSCRQAGDWAAALGAFEHVRLLDLETRAHEKEIAICLRELGRLSESEAILCAELESQPEWAGAHFELGRTCEARQSWARAEREFQRAVDLRPAWVEPRAALARLRRRTVACS